MDNPMQSIYLKLTVIFQQIGPVAGSRPKPATLIGSQQVVTNADDPVILTGGNLCVIVRLAPSYSSKIPVLPVDSAYSLDPRRFPDRLATGPSMRTITLFCALFAYSLASNDEDIYDEDPIWTEVTVHDSERGENIIYRVYVAT